MERLEKGAATVRYVHTVNGGRLTKWKGQLASCAPMVGLAVAMLVGASPAMAASECGADAAGFDTINCASGTYASGITYLNSDGLQLNLNDPAITVSSTTGIGVTVKSDTTTTNDVVINASNFGTITGASGVLVSNQGLGGATFTMGAGDILSTGAAGNGVAVWGGNAASTGALTGTIDGGTITTTGTNSHGIRAYQTGTGSAVLTLNSGDISTTGATSDGIYTRIVNTSSTATASAIMNGGSVTTTGNDSVGVGVVNLGKGDATALVTGGTISTAGLNAHGMVVYITNATSAGTASSTLTNGDITTTGNNAYGVYASTAGTGAALAQMDGGTINTSGQDANGVFSSTTNTTSTGTSSATMTAGDITTTGTRGYGVYAQTSGLGNAIATQSGSGNIVTGGLNANGLYAYVNNTASSATASTTLDGGTITTSGSGAHGLDSWNTGLGAATTTLTNGNVATNGDNAFGLFAYINNSSSSSDAVATMENGTVDTIGSGSYGLFSQNNGNGNAIATLTNGDITTAGVQAYGLSSYIATPTSTGTTTVTMDGGTITTTGDNGHGLFAQNYGLGDAVAQMDGGTINTSGLSASGLFSNITNAASTGTATATLTAGDITTTGDKAKGVYATTAGLGDATVQMDGGTVTTSGLDASGIEARISNTASTATATALLTNGDITVQGDSSTNEGYGVHAYTNGTGDALAQMDGGHVTVAGLHGAGVRAWTESTATTATMTAILNDGDIEITGDAVFGVQAYAAKSTNSADVLVQINGGSVTNSGDNGAAARAITLGLGNATVTMTAGSISSSGAGDWGLSSEIRNAGSAATATVRMDGGSITATGVESDGIVARNTGTGVFDVVVNGGTVTSGSGQAAGIRTAAASGGTIDIAAGATVDGSASNIAIRDGDFDRDGIDEVGGNVVVTTEGNVIGDAILGLGDDTFNFVGGDYDGDIYGDEKVASAADGNDTFNWSGGTWHSAFYGGNGSDTANITAATYDGTHILDGGDDTSAADGWIDTLNMDGITGVTINGALVTNWEVINLANSDVTINSLVAGDLAITDSTVVANDLTADSLTLTNADTTLAGASVVPTVNVNGGTTTIAGTSNVTDILGSILDETIIVDGDATVGTIEGAGGSDSITVQGNSSVDTIDVAGAGNDNSAAADTNNTVVINTTGSVNTILGGNGNDDITLTSGTVGTVNAGAGNNVITADGANVTAIIGGSGDDTVTWSAGNVDSISLGDGSDTLLVSAPAYDGSQFLDGGDDTSSADGYVDTVTFQGVNATTTSSNLANWEKIIVDGGTLGVSDGTLTTGTGPGEGLILNNGGALDAGNNLVLNGNLTIGSGSTFDGTGGGNGNYVFNGGVINNGIITTVDGVVGDVVTVNGDYTGNGQILMDIDTATATGDSINFNGDVSGHTEVVVNNVSPGSSNGQPIDLINVGNGSSADSFVLSGGSKTFGAYDYSLDYQAGSFILFPTLNSTGAVYEVAPVVLAGFNRLPTLEERVGQRQWAGSNSARSALQPSTGAWVRMHGDRSKLSTTSGNSIDNKAWGFQMGWDALVKPSNHGQWVLGLTTQYGTQDADVTLASGKAAGTVRAKGYGVGATATWYGNEGTYADIQGQMNWVSSDLASSKAGSLVDGQRARTHAESVEVGHRIALNQNNTLVPQAQLTAGRVSANTFTDSVNNEVDLGSNSSLVGRVGLAYQYENNAAAEGSRQKFYAIGNVLHNFADDSSVTVRGGNLTTGVTRTWGEVGVGSSVTLDDNKTLYGSVAYRHSLDGTRSSGMAVTAGLRVQW